MNQVIVFGNDNIGIQIYSEIFPDAILVSDQNTALKRATLYPVSAIINSAARPAIPYTSFRNITLRLQNYVRMGCDVNLGYTISRDLASKVLNFTITLNPDPAIEVLLYNPVYPVLACTVLDKNYVFVRLFKIVLIALSVILAIILIIYFFVWLVKRQQNRKCQKSLASEATVSRTSQTITTLHL